MKKLISSLLAAMVLGLALTACGGGDASTAAPADTGDGAEATDTAEEGDAPAAQDAGDRQVVTFWYNNSGDEALVYEAAIAAYNDAQDTYFVEGLSVNDPQKTIVAMSSNEAPDAIKVSNYDVIQYQLNGLLENLQGYIDFDLGIYSDHAVAGNSLDGDMYGLPLSAYTIQLYYNVDLLKDAGFDAPPETVEEMYEMAVAATVIDDGGSFEVLGYPLFPFASARQELIYAFGGRWWAEDGLTMTPDTQGALDSLNMNVAYRELYGTKAINEFIAEANTNRYGPQDMFFQGRQLFRLDGSWLPTMMAEHNSDVNWGVTFIPGTKANPELRGVSRFETDSIAVPVMAENKEGAYDFAKWLCGEDGAKIIHLGTGTPPALLSLYEDPEILAIPGLETFIEALQLEKGIQYPTVAYYSEYMALLNDTLDEIYVGNITPEDGLADLAQKVAGLS